MDLANAGQPYLELLDLKAREDHYPVNIQ